MMTSWSNSAQDKEPNLEYQSVKFAESSVEHHNNEANNEVKYELIKAMESRYMSESDSVYGHVSFMARPKKDGSKEQLFFAELRLHGEITFLTCFCCLKEGDQVG
ncbi:hypothetical protein GQ55_4G087200 [Panicum hallii var. hallii]|uniref:DUF3615 domain-containing protein n=1 Tax=Panicum hallii var. hallii TaxID=1504633 RepID=A0A2T7DWN2_9POAL|nr:hypothetical protein GQ55_4G087200 [Panicum hallii var. hallii]